jgi:hypothetical protein
MTKNIPSKRFLSTCLLLALPLAACAQDDFHDEDAIGESVNLVNGGLDMEDEAPMFGEAALFESAELAEESDVSDALADDPELVAMGQLPGALRIHTAIQWGQLPVNPAAETVVDWSGTISVNRGAIIVRRVIAFEPALGDSIAPRVDPRSVSFTSTTLPANDGLRLTIIDPTPQAEEPLTLDYSDDTGSVYSVAVHDLIGAPQSFDIGVEGNRIVAVAMPQLDGDCQYGFLRGRWHRVAPNRGRLLGRVRAADGELLGHMRGIYGQRANGNRVFFGKYIGNDGLFRGIFAGRYQDGHFRGLWMNQGGEVGALGGHYRETIPGPEVGGHFLGRWAESSCNVQVGPGSDMPDQP